MSDCTPFKADCEGVVLTGDACTLFDCVGVVAGVVLEDENCTGDESEDCVGS